MTLTNRPFVHMTINAVDAVVLDPDGRFDPEIHDHYETFEAARDAALTSIEVMLDEADYDGEDHREELERMRGMLETAQSFDELKVLPAYRWFLRRIPKGRTVAA